MKNNCYWVNYRWVIIQNQTVILKTMSSCIEFLKLCYRKELGDDTSQKADKNTLLFESWSLQARQLINWLMFQLIWII